MTTMSEEQMRIRGYLQAQAAKLSIAELVAKVRSDQEQVRAAAETAPAARFYQRPAEDEWSANEVFAHVVDSGAVVGAGILAVLDGGSPPAVADRIRPGPERRTAAEWWSLLTRDREALFERVSAAAGHEHLHVTWPHPFFGELNWREWLLFLRIHDLDHARQLQAVTAAIAG
jgi:uncharacterized damage-inducible protein DinB